MSLQLNGDTGVSAVQDGAVQQSDLAANVVGNGPAFSAYLSTNQSIPPNVATKINVDTEEFDTAGVFSAGRFTPTVAGYYQFNWSVNFAAMVASIRISMLLKNGARFKDGNGSGSNGSASAETCYATGSALVYLNGTTDYVEFAAQHSNAANVAVIGGASHLTYFQGVLVRAA